MIHNAIGRGHHEVSELTRWQDVSRKLFDATKGDVEAWGDDAAFVDTPDEVNDDLFRELGL